MSAQSIYRFRKNRQETETYRNSQFVNKVSETAEPIELKLSRMLACIMVIPFSYPENKFFITGWTTWAGNFKKSSFNREIAFIRVSAQSVLSIENICKKEEV